MRTLKSAYAIILAVLAGILATGCRNEGADTVRVDKDIEVAVYSTVGLAGDVDTVSPCLMKERIHISELLHYPDDEGITMPFCFSDTVRYAEITERSIDKRIAISVNGEVVSKPVVKMRLNDGVCSVVLDEAQVASLFPEVDVKSLGLARH